MAATPAQDAALAAITSAVSTLRASLDTPPPAPGYTVTATPSPVSEGGTVTFAVSGPAGAVVAYMLEGISSADVTVPLVGTLTLDASGAGSLVVGVVADALTEGAETITCRVNAVVASTSVSIVDASQSPPPPPPPPPAVQRSCLYCNGLNDFILLCYGWGCDEIAVNEITEPLPVD